MQGHALVRGGLRARRCKSEGRSFVAAQLPDSDTHADGSKSEFNWYAVYTRHQHEKSAARLLAGKGFDTLLPLYQARHRWKDRTQTVHLPLFPCYLFISASMERRVEILRTPGVCWLVGNGGFATPIPERQVESIRTLIASSLRFEPHPFLASGDCVRVRSGPLAGVEGILVRVKNGHRLVLSVQLLKQSAAVEVDGSLVERISPLSKAATAFSYYNERTVG